VDSRVAISPVAFEFATCHSSCRTSEPQPPETRLSHALIAPTSRHCSHRIDCSFLPPGRRQQFGTNVTFRNVSGTNATLSLFTTTTLRLTAPVDLGDGDGRCTDDVSSAGLPDSRGTAMHRRVSLLRKGSCRSISRILLVRVLWQPCVPALRKVQLRLRVSPFLSGRSAHLHTVRAIAPARPTDLQDSGCH
jgi:hypothetical protein